MSNYGIERTLSDTSFDQAVERITAALKEEGFGVLTEIDVRGTLKKKLDVDFRPYKILGACNPQLAHQALQAVPDIGLLLPCNVIVADNQDGSTLVSILDPKAMFALVDQPGIEEVAADARRRLERALENM